MKSIALSTLALLTLAPAFAQTLPDRMLLAEAYPLESLNELILSRESWKPYPTLADPSGFERIPERVQQEYITQAERLLEEDWAPLPATVFLQFARSGNRSNYEKLSFDRRKHLATLVLAEAFERKGRFMDQVINGLWAVCEESFWGVPAHVGAQKVGSGLPDVTEPTVDLFAAETGMLMAWTSYLLGPALDEVNPVIRQRIAYEVDRRILTPFIDRDDWGWMGFTWRNRTGYVRPVNNWNPWINSNVLAAALILEEDPERRLRLVHKVMDSVDNFIAPYPADGGCDEGPSYWGRAAASLFDVLELLHQASNGKINASDQPLIREAGRYIYKLYIADPYFINFADAEAKMRVEPSLVYRYGKAIGDEPMMQFAAYTAELENYGSGVLPASFGTLGRTLPALFSLEELAATSPREPLLRDAWLPDLQVMTARSRADSREGFYVAAKGGHNDESHNHNDVGNFVIFHDGMPVLIDAGRQTYTAQTFSSRRYELWNNQSAYHNVPTVNGVMQMNGHAYAAREVVYEADNERARFSLDLAGAYPEEAQVDSWYRTLTLYRNGPVELVEDYRLKAFVAPSTLNFLTPLTAGTGRKGRITLTDPTGENPDTFTVTYDPDRFEPQVETVQIDDTLMSGVWGDELYRIMLISKENRVSDRIVIRIDTE